MKKCPNCGSTRVRRLLTQHNYKERCDKCGRIHKRKISPEEHIKLQIYLRKIKR